jgi:hypothetical protein
MGRCSPPLWGLRCANGSLTEHLGSPEWRIFTVRVIAPPARSDPPAPLVEGCAVDSLHFDTGLRGKDCGPISMLGARPRRCRALGEAILCRGRSGAGLWGKLAGSGGILTGLRGNSYRASGEICADISLQIKGFCENRLAPCLKSVKGYVVVLVNNRGGIWQEGRMTGLTW